jgi:hypothetical protein
MLRTNVTGSHGIRMPRSGYELPARTTAQRWTTPELEEELTHYQSGHGTGVSKEALSEPKKKSLRLQAEERAAQAAQRDQCAQGQAH